jgi:tetratricopeptide (TPR) repeat protein
MALIIIELALMRTRGVWLGLVGGVGVTVLLHLLSKNRDNLPLKPIFIGTGAFAVLLAGVFLFTGSKEKILDTTNLNIRTVYWNNSVEMAKDYPLTGVGAGNWKVNFPAYGLSGTNSSVVMGETSIIQPHNDMLWVLAETGVPGWLAFAAFQLLMLFAGVKLLARTTGERRHEVMAAIFGLIAFATYGLFEFPIERVATFGLIVLPLANLLFLAEENDVLQRKLIQLPAIVPIATVVAFAVVGLWVFSARMSGEKDASKAVNAYIKRDAKTMLAYATDAQSNLFELDIYLNPMEFFIGLGLMDQSRFVEAEQTLKEGLEKNPNHLNTMVQLGDCYKFQKKFDQAILVYDEILKISPAFYRANLNKAEIYIRQNKVYEALACLNRVNYRINYPKYQEVGLAVLRPFIEETQPQQFAPLHALLQQSADNPAQAWQIYNNWKRDRILALNQP